MWRSSGRYGCRSMSKVALRARFNTGLPRFARNDTVPLARAFSGRSRDREGNNRTT